MPTDNKNKKNTKFVTVPIFSATSITFQHLYYETFHSHLRTVFATHSDRL